MKRLAYMLIAIALFPLATMGQSYSQKEKPFWADGYFREMKNSYLEVVHAFGYNLKSARDQAVKEVISRRSMATGTSASVSISNNDISVKAGHELIVKARIIEEYAMDNVDGGYIVYLLVQTAKNPIYEYETVNVTNEYPFSSRVFVPGMAQLHKGSSTKGLLFIASEVVSVAGIVVSECLRTSYNSKYSSTHNVSARRDYASKADNMANIRNVCIAGAVAVYAWNVIDGIVAKGKRHIDVNDTYMRVSPYASMQSAGLTLSYRF